MRTKFQDSGNSDVAEGNILSVIDLLKGVVTLDSATLLQLFCEKPDVFSMEKIQGGTTERSMLPITSATPTNQNITNKIPREKPEE